MIRTGKKRKDLLVILALLLALLVGAGSMPMMASAASGKVYSCTINRAYAHPLTGTIEDSGGPAAFTTGQGMVEGTIHPGGMLEMTDDGQYFLTIRMSLVDFVSNVNFSVQNVGESGWKSAPMGTTGSGKDNTGTTWDICIQVPSENCIVRGSMFVEPMGRNVIYYIYPSGYQEGNSVGMNATIVTESSAGGTQLQETPMGSAAGGIGEAGASGNLSGSIGGGVTPQSMMGQKQGANPMAGPGANSGAINSASGLSLSTAKGLEGEGDENSGNLPFGAKQALGILTVGLVLIGVASLVVYYFRKNWHRIGVDDDYEDDDQ